AHGITILGQLADRVFATVGGGDLRSHVGRSAWSIGSEEEVDCRELEIVGAYESSDQTKVTCSNPP
ncbi:MAG: hypothetical protein ABGZ17_19355, partial [Planctomycetaceae bacterium]